MCPIADRRSHFPDIISNKVQLIFDNLPSALEQSRGGTVRALGVTSPQRWPGVPDVPAIAETVPGFESVGFYGISAPKGTPPEIVDTLNKAVGEALKDPKLVARLSEIGGIPKPMTPAEFGKLIVDETDKVAQGGGIRGRLGGLECCCELQVKRLVVAEDAVFVEGYSPFAAQIGFDVWSQRNAIVHIHKRGDFPFECLHPFGKSVAQSFDDLKQRQIDIGRSAPGDESAAAVVQ